MPGYGAVCWGSLDEAKWNPGFNWKGLWQNLIGLLVAPAVGAIVSHLLGSLWTSVVR